MLIVRQISAASLVGAHSVSLQDTGESSQTTTGVYIVQIDVVDISSVSKYIQDAEVIRYQYD